MYVRGMFLFIRVSFACTPRESQILSCHTLYLQQLHQQPIAIAQSVQDRYRQNPMATSQQDVRVLLFFSFEVKSLSYFGGLTYS